VVVTFVPVAFTQTRLPTVAEAPFRLSAFTVVPEAVVKPSQLLVTFVKVPFVEVRSVALSEEIVEDVANKVAIVPVVAVRLETVPFKAFRFVA
jgi:hypothetical protein